VSSNKEGENAIQPKYVRVRERTMERIDEAGWRLLIARPLRMMLSDSGRYKTVWTQKQWGKTRTRGTSWPCPGDTGGLSGAHGAARRLYSSKLSTYSLGYVSLTTNKRVDTKNKDGSGADSLPCGVGRVGDGRIEAFQADSACTRYNSPGV